MKVWWTLSELAERLPETRQGLMARAARENWRDAARVSGEPLARKRAGRGGGMEFHVSLLPLASQAALVDAPVERQDETVPDLEIETATDARTRDARLAVLALAAKFRDATGLAQKEADRAFSEAYSSGSIVIDAAVRAVVPTVSRPTLCRWRAAVRSGDGAKIASRQGRTKGTSHLAVANDGEVAAIIGGMLVNNPMFTAQHVSRYIAAKFPNGLNINGRNEPLPSIASFHRFIADFKATHKVALSKLTNPDQFKNRYSIAGLAQGRHTGISKLNEVWQIDASPADALCLDGRYSVYLCVDIWSRRLVGYVSKTARATSVKLLLRKALLTWGVPDRIETDNGSDFIANATTALLAALAIAHHRCNPYQGQEKGHVERAVRTFQHDCGRMLPGFIGHNVADRKRIEAKKTFAARLGCDDKDAFKVDMSSGELQAYLDTWCECEYGQRAHSSLAGQSPFQKAADYTGGLRRVESERALDVLLMDVADGGGIRTIGRQGIRIDGEMYIAPGLMVGEKVMVRLDPADLGRALCFTPDGASYLGEAMWPEAIGVSRAEAVAQARARQKVMIDESTAAIRKAAKAIKPRDVIDTILRASAERSGKLISFPKPSTSHTTPQLGAASEALSPRSNAPAEMPPELLQQHEQAIAEFQARIAAGTPEAPKPTADIIPMDSDERRFVRAIDLETRIAGGEIIPADLKRWLDGYQETAEYQARRSMLDDYGDVWFAGVRSRVEGSRADKKQA